MLCFRTIVCRSTYQELKELAVETPAVRKLSLKLIVHYSVIEEILVKGFYKRYENVVIEAHCLLKNTIGGNTYALMTDAYLKANGDEDFAVENMGSICEIYSGIGKICYSCFPYSSYTGTFSN